MYEIPALNRVRQLQDLETKLFHTYRVCLETYGSNAPETETAFSFYNELTQVLRFIRGQESYYDALMNTADLVYAKYVKDDIAQIQKQSQTRQKPKTGFRWSLF